MPSVPLTGPRPSRPLDDDPQQVPRLDVPRERGRVAHLHARDGRGEDTSFGIARHCRHDDTGAELHRVRAARDLDTRDALLDQHADHGGVAVGLGDDVDASGFLRAHEALRVDGRDVTGRAVPRHVRCVDVPAVGVHHARDQSRRVADPHAAGRADEEDGGRQARRAW